jgi:hypothetical protein
VTLYVQWNALLLPQHWTEAWLSIYYRIKLDANANENAFMYGYQDYLDADIFQNIMSKLIQDMEYVKTIFFLDDFLLLTNISFKVLLLNLDMILLRLLTAGMRVNISKSKFFAEKYNTWDKCITRQFVLATCNKVEMNGIVNIKMPKQEKKNKIRYLNGIVNYNCNISYFAEVTF